MIVNVLHCDRNSTHNADRNAPLRHAPFHAHVSIKKEVCLYAVRSATGDAAGAAANGEYGKNGPGGQDLCRIPDARKRVRVKS